MSSYVASPFAAQALKSRSEPVVLPALGEFKRDLAIKLGTDKEPQTDNKRVLHAQGVIAAAQVAISIASNWAVAGDILENGVLNNRLVANPGAHEALAQVAEALAIAGYNEKGHEKEAVYNACAALAEQAREARLLQMRRGVGK